MTCEGATADSLTLWNFRSNELGSAFTRQVYVLYLDNVIPLKQKAQQSAHAVERVIIYIYKKRELLLFQHFLFHRFLSKFM